MGVEKTSTTEINRWDQVKSVGLGGLTTGAALATPKVVPPILSVAQNALNATLTFTGKASEAIWATTSANYVSIIVGTVATVGALWKWKKNNEKPSTIAPTPVTTLEKVKQCAKFMPTLIGSAIVNIGVSALAERISKMDVPSLDVVPSFQTCALLGIFAFPGIIIRLSRCIKKGPIVDEKTLSELKKDVDAGDARACVSLGCYHYKKNDYTNAYLYFEKAAKLDYELGFYNLGIMHTNGHGVPQDSQMALKFYLKAAEKGYINAIHSVVEYYEKYPAIEWYLKEAEYWRKKAAEKGSVTEMSQLVKFYERNYKIDGSYTKAEYWRNKILEQSSPSNGTTTKVRFVPNQENKSEEA